MNLLQLPADFLDFKLSNFLNLLVFLLSFMAFIRQMRKDSREKADEVKRHQDDLHAQNRLRLDSLDDVVKDMKTKLTLLWAREEQRWRGGHRGNPTGS